MATQPENVDVCGDDLLALHVDSPALAQALAGFLRDSGHWLEAVAGIDSVVVRFDVAKVDVVEAIAQLVGDESEADLDIATRNASIDIPVIYDGPDLDDVCSRLSLTREQFIELHTGADHVVDMLGFTPGFAYISGAGEVLDVPRLTEPRQRVDEGAIGIAGGRTGVYALPGPAGWPIVARTEKPLFDAGLEQPFLLAAGMRVRFVEDTTE